ncbi:MAG: hypothetical protein ABJA94_00540 [Rhodoglobus sp.]
MTSDRTIDFSALITPVSSTQVAQYKSVEKLKPSYTSASTVSRVIVAIIAIGFVGLTLLGFINSALAIAISAVQDGSTVGLLPLVGPLIFLAFVVFAIFAIFRTVLKGGNSWERWYRLDTFAQENGLIFSRADPNPQYPGSIFGQGDSRVVTEHLRSATDRFVDYGNYRYVTGSGKSRTTHNWGFLALQMDRALPNIVLDSKANNGLFGSTNLPAVFAKSQVLHLEGDFDKYFTLYCPKEYEADALYIFTPDLMALLIDEASPFDVEIVDKWLFVYSSKVFDLRQPALHQRLFRIVDTVGAKALSQTDRYTDERVGDFAANVVAPGGQRLKRGISVGAIVFGAVFIAIWAMPWIADLFSAGR